MPSIDTIDSIEIDAPANDIFSTVIDYPNFETWFPLIQCCQVDTVSSNSDGIGTIAEGSNRIAEGSRIKHVFGRPPHLIINSYTRTIRRVAPGKIIEETYDEGDLLGKGTWIFEEHDGTTKTSYHCDVQANTLSLRLCFMLTGAVFHNMIYGRILKALKAHCENNVNR